MNNFLSIFFQQKITIYKQSLVLRQTDLNLCTSRRTFIACMFNQCCKIRRWTMGYFRFIRPNKNDWFVQWNLRTECEVSKKSELLQKTTYRWFFFTRLFLVWNLFTPLTLDSASGSNIIHLCWRQRVNQKTYWQRTPGWRPYYFQGWS